MKKEYSVSYTDSYTGTTYNWLVEANSELAAQLICHNKLRENKLIAKGCLQSFLALCSCELIDN